MMGQNMGRQGGGGGYDRPSGSSAYGRDSMGNDRLGRSSSSRLRHSTGSASALPGRRSDSNKNNTSAVHRGGRGSIGGGNSSSTLAARGGRKRYYTN